LPRQLIRAIADALNTGSAAHCADGRGNGSGESPGPSPRPGSTAVNRITTTDGAEIYYKDWGAGRPVSFSHGWPLNADAWDDQMLFLAARGFRCVAHDRRGHGRSSQPWTGNNLDTYADDLAALIEALDLRSAILIGHATGGGEVTRYIGRYGTGRVSKVVLISAIPPLMLKTPANRGGLPIEVFDDIRARIAGDRSQYYRELGATFYGANRPGSKVSQSVEEALWFRCMQTGLKGALDCIKAFSETDLTEDLKKFDVPTLIIHGDDDQIVPIVDTALLSSKLIKKAKLKVYPGAPHGLMVTHKAQLNSDLLAFIES
jgi:non-heme chloroperoxidase